MTELVVKIGGQAGQGANVTGRSLGKIFARSGLNVIGYPEYPSLVRGGHNVYEVRVSDETVRSPIRNCNIIVALNKDAIFFHHNYLNEPGAIIYDSKVDVTQFNLSDKILLYPLNISKILEDAKGNSKMTNIVMLGALLSLICYPIDELNNIIRETFVSKGGDIVNSNLSCASLGYGEVEKMKKDGKEYPIKIPVGSGNGKMIIGGNEAAGIGAIAGGLKFYSAYPMTPASTILHYLAKVARESNIVVKHTEDEISAINYAVGASYTGARAMTGTSGGGFALMTETVGMTALAETPLVVYIAQRTGPSTGMPTWTEQADLKFVLNASQGDFLRVVLAPGSVEESYKLTADALNITDKYQLPVFVLTDKFLAESHFSCEKFDNSIVNVDRGKIAKGLSELKPMERFKRYELTEDGISKRSFPGEPNGMHVATSYVHNETGYSTESFIIRNKMVDKRARKISALLKELPKPNIYKRGDNNKLALIVWGSHLLPALDSQKELGEKGINVDVIHFNVLFPLDSDEINTMFSNYEKTIVIENNSTSQFAGILREYTGFTPDFYMLRYDGRPFFPENITDNVENLSKNGFKGEKRVVINEDEDLEYYNTQRFGL